jgi:plastocyanin
MKKAVVAIVVVLIIIGAIIGLKGSDNKNSSTTTTQPTTQNTTSTNQTAEPSAQSSNSSSTDQTQSQNTITYSNDSFSPSTLTVKAGTTVTVKNASSQAIQFDSDPHPVHTDNTDLNVGVISAGQSKTFLTNRTGSFGYHNHLNPSETGTLVVQ